MSQITDGNGTVASQACPQTSFGTNREEIAECTYRRLEVFQQAIFISSRGGYPVVSDQGLCEDKSVERTSHQYCQTR